jgi:hypothetical protein
MEEIKMTGLNWEEHKKNIIKELAKLERLNWAENDGVAATIFPYVLIEAINILENSTAVENPVDYTLSGEDAEKMLDDILGA